MSHSVEKKKRVTSLLCFKSNLQHNKSSVRKYKEHAKLWTNVNEVNLPK